MQFRPIGLCNVNYKILSKILVNRIKPYLNKLVGKEHVSFVPVRQITDNVLILQELTHSMRTNTGKQG